MVGISGIGEELVDPLSQGGDLFGIGGEKIDLADLAPVGQRHRLVVIVIIANNVAAGILRNLRADFWFAGAAAAAAAPSIPFANARWGERCWRAKADAQSRSSNLRTRKAYISPIHWKAGARR